MWCQLTSKPVDTNSARYPLRLMEIPQMLDSGPTKSVELRKGC